MPSVDLNDIYVTEEINAMIRSWLAWSATNIMYSPNGEVAIAVRSNAVARAIPEPGDYALCGGFNTVIDSPAMMAAVADAHAFTQFGLRLSSGQCSPFLPCEYDMSEIKNPLNTPFGKLDMKRQAHDRIVLLSEQQKSQINAYLAQYDGMKIDQLKAEGVKISAVEWWSQETFMKKLEERAVSFPYQVDHVLEGFDWAKKKILPKRVGWML